MEKRIHLYVSRKHPALWLTGLLMLASVAAGFAVFSRMDGAGAWWRIVLPGMAVLAFVVMAFVSGEEMLFRTAVPVWVLGLCVAGQLPAALPGRPLVLVLSWGCILW